MTTSADTASAAGHSVGSGSRRALLVGTLGGFAAWLASAIGRAGPVRADGETMIVGDEYFNAQSVTKLVNSTNTATVFRADNTNSGGGTAIEGFSNAGTGVHGNSASGFFGVAGVSGSGAGVYGQSTSSHGVRGYSNQSVGVHGYSDGTGQPAILGWSGTNSTAMLGVSNDGVANPPAAKARTGVYGQATQDSTSRGVWGRSNAGQGVRGQATSGVGLYGTATSGYALRTGGRLKVDKVSGVATIAAGDTGVTVTPGVDVNSGSFVLLTPKVNLGGRALWFTTDPANNRFTIHISSARSSATRIAWLLLG